MDVSKLIMLEVFAPRGVILAQCYFNTVESAEARIKEIGQLALLDNTSSVFKDDIGTMHWIKVSSIQAMRVYSIKAMLEHSCEFNNQRERIQKEYDPKTGAGFLN